MGSRLGIRWAIWWQNWMFWPVRTRKWVRCWCCIYNRYHCFPRNPFLMFFSATKVDGGYLLNGTKMWITNSYESQAGVVFATSDKSQKHRVCIEFAEFLPKEVFNLVGNSMKIGFFFKLFDKKFYQFLGFTTLTLLKLFGD